MSRQDLEFSVRRILICLDTSGHGLAALDAAVQMASRLHAEILGLFVEDVQILRMAGLPFAREMGMALPGEEALDLARIEREMRVEAEKARRALAEAAERARCSWSFRVVRGEVTPEVLAAGVEVDLISLGKTRRAGRQRVPPGSTALAAVTGASIPVLLAQSGVLVDGPIAAFYEGTPLSRRALVAAERLTATGARLLVVTPAPDPAASERLRREASAALEGPSAAYFSIPATTVAALAEFAEAQRIGLLILGGDSPVLRPETASELLSELTCPVLVVR